MNFKKLTILSLVFLISGVVGYLFPDVTLANKNFSYSRQKLMRESRDNAKRLQRIKKNRQKDYGSKSESFLFVFPKIRIRYLEGSISNKTTKVQNSIKTVILGDWGISQSVLRYETFKSNNSYDVINNSYDISYTFGNKLNFTLGLGFIYEGMANIRTSKNLYTSSRVSGNSFFGVLGFELGMIEFLIGNRINNMEYIEFHKNSYGKILEVDTKYSISGNQLIFGIGLNY